MIKVIRFEPGMSGERERMEMNGSVSDDDDDDDERGLLCLSVLL